MSDKNGFVQEPERKRPFIREKVAKPPRTKRQMAFRVFAYVILAAIAGIAAGTSFAVAGPLAERYLMPTTAAPTVPTVKIPTDTETVSSADVAASAETQQGTTADSEPAVSESVSASETAQPETASSEPTEPPTTEEETEPETTKPIGEILQSAIEEYNYTVDDLNSMYTALRDVVNTANNGIVVIHSVRQELDWFDNPIETAGLYAGAVIAATEQELMILTPAAAIENADALRVTFVDGEEADCTVRQTDSITGMAVVSVGLSALEEKTRGRITAIPLGNSFLVKQGDVVIAAGAPTGAVHSSAYGFISNIVRNVQVPDGVMRLLYADVTADAASGTFLLNTMGELVGWVTDDYESANGIAVAAGISDYKTMLEKMSNGVSIPYLGIQPQEVSEAMQESGMPAGIYVSECSIDGPAYEAGIQSGDIIVQIGEADVTKISEYQSQVAALNEGDLATVVVQRRGADEYIELEYQVNVGAR